MADIKKKAVVWVLAAVAVALCVYIWIDGQNGAKPPANSAKATAEPEAADYYADFRVNREETRKLEAEAYTLIIDDEGADESTRQEARKAMMRLAQNMEHELVIEELLLAKGYADAAVTASEGGINVVVKAESLTPAQTAIILEAVTRQTGMPATSVYIVASP